jgi:hypothetical protein
MVGGVVNSTATSIGCALISMSIYKKPDNYMIATLPLSCSIPQMSPSQVDHVLQQITDALAHNEYHVTRRDPPPLTMASSTHNNNDDEVGDSSSSSSPASFMKPSPLCPPEHDQNDHTHTHAHHTEL